MELRLRRRALGAGAAGLAGTAAGLSATPLRALAQTVEAEELRFVVPLGFFGLDPVHMNQSVGQLRNVGAGDGLLRFTPGGEVEADLARSFGPLDPLTWEAQLRPEVTFWSGKPVNAQAVVESLERSRRLAPVAATLMRGIRVEASDEWTVRFLTDTPLPGLPLNIANNWCMIHNAESYGPADNPFDLRAMDLTGPFRVTTFEPRVRATLVRNGSYWGPLPRTRRIVFGEVGDTDARTLAALSGEAHVVNNIGTAAARQMERSRTMRLAFVPGAGTTLVRLNLDRAPFSDARLRQALGWATDREELVTLAFDGYGTAATSWLAPNPLFPEAKRVGFTKLDLLKAGQLLDEAGWRLAPGARVRTKDGQPLRFRLYWQTSGRVIAEILQAQWGRLGVEVAVEGASDGSFITRQRDQGDWDAFIEAQGSFGEPGTIMMAYHGPGGVLNYVKHQDPQIDALLAGLDTIYDGEERRQQGLRINERHAEIGFFIPLAAPGSLNAVSRDVRNYIPHFMGTYTVHPDLWVSA